MTRASSPLTLEFILLGLLEQHPLHGYDLFRELNAIRGIRLIWNLKQSMLYALLDKLEADGLLQGLLIQGEARPSRREYSLTGEGRRAFGSWLQTPVEHGRDMRQDFLARLYFASRVGTETALTLIDLQRQTCTRWLADMQTQYEAVDRQVMYDRFVLSFRIHQIEAMLTWLEVCKQDLMET